MANAQALMNDFHHRRKAVGGARGSGQQVMRLRAIFMIVDPDHDIERAIFHRCGDNHFSHTAVEIRLQGLSSAELARAFEDEVDAEVLPRHLTGGRFFTEGQALAVDDDRLRFMRHRVIPPAMHRVERQQVRGGFGATFGLVDVHELKVRPHPSGAQNEPTHASEAVDADANGHEKILKRVGINNSTYYDL